MYITHLLFVDEILVFCDGSRRDVEKICQWLALFKRATRMQINGEKSTISCANLEEMEIMYLVSRLPFQVQDLDAGLNI